MKARMNLIDLAHALNSMDDTSKYEQYILDGIKSAIIRVYCEKSGFYEEHAIKAYEMFLKTGILIFN